MRIWLRFLPLVLTGMMAAALADATYAADIIIKPAPGPSWKIASGGTGQSDGATPLKVMVKTGDTILFDLSASNAHGVATISKKATDDNPVAAPSLVWSCAQASAPDGAVLREVECTGTSTIFNPPLGDGTTGKLKLKVLDNLVGDVNFWCTVHTDQMWGIISLTP